MKISIHEFRSLVRDPENLEQLPIGRDCVRGEVLTATGAAAACHANAKLARIATDTAVSVNAYGAGFPPVFLPAGAIEWFPVASAQVLTFS